MKVFVAGATGALGVPLVNRLIAEGHTVTGMAGSNRRTEAIAAMGAQVVVVDARDAAGVRSAVVAAHPEVVVHALTAIPARGPLRASDVVATNALRTNGTASLLSAAMAAGVRRFVLESMVFIYGFGDLGDVPFTEDRPLGESVPKPWLRPAVDAMVAAEAQVRHATSLRLIDGVALRFGGFYGLGAGTEAMVGMLRRRALPVVPSAPSRGVPWIHIHDAASALAGAVTGDRVSATYNIVDDEAVPACDFIRELARTSGAPQPWSIPAWVMRLTAPFAAAAWVDTTLKVSNERAKRELEWAPRFKTYRDGLALFARSADKNQEWFKWIAP